MTASNAETLLYLLWNFECREVLAHVSLQLHHGQATRLCMCAHGKSWEWGRFAVSFEYSDLCLEEGFNQRINGCSPISSPYRSSAIRKHAACATDLRDRATFSMSVGLIFVPPLLMISLILPISFR